MMCSDSETPHIQTQEGVVYLHTAKEFDAMRKAGRLAATVLDYITPFVQPGITTNRLDELCETFIRDHGAVPAPLGYKGYPKSICTSLNHVVCHGIPNDKPLLSTDMLNIDVTVILDGWHGDTSRMFVLEPVPPIAKDLVQTTKQALEGAIALVKPGAFLGDIGFFIENLALKKGFSVVCDYCGHGIGRQFHCAPSVLHVGHRNTGLQLQEGMIFTIEPMLNVGKADTKTLQDGWTVVTKDKKLSAQFEHTVGVTKDGVEIFTTCTPDQA
ncbi:MAG: type I methionyl aminopeptidase [Holosporaceae bacterium]